MATQTKRPRGRETRQALIQAGVEEINRHGVTEFSVRRIAQICGVSCGAPYKHFGDRREFIAAVIEYVNDQWRAEQTKILTAYEGDLQKQLVEVSTGYVKFLVEHPHLRAILTLKDEEGGAQQPHPAAHRPLLPGAADPAGGAPAEGLRGPRPDPGGGHPV